MVQTGIRKPGSGRRPAPTTVLKARGSWRAKVREKTEPQPAVGIPECPSNLQGLAKRTWDEMCRLLEGVGILTEIDGRALARYCDGWAAWVTLAKDKSPDPEYKRLDKRLKISEHLLRFEIQYGLTPASRPHIHRLEKPAHGNAKKAGKARFFTAS